MGRARPSGRRGACGAGGEGDGVGPTGGRANALAGEPGNMVFSGLFPELLPQAGVCSCGSRHEIHDPISLPVYQPVPDEVLAEEAERSPMVRRAVALATWLGS